MTRLSLGDLVDLEARILEEQGDSEETRRSRYRQFGRRLADQGPLPQDPGALLKALLTLDPRPDSLGRRFAAALRLVHILLAVLGLLVGASLTLGLIHNDQGRPANVLTVVFVLVGVQLLVLALFLIALFPTGHDRASGPVHHLLLGLMHAILRRVGVEQKVLALQDRLDAHRGLLRWSLIRATQVFGVAFNVAVIAAAMFRFATTDIHFGWSTTLGVQPETVHRIVKAASAPWSWIKPDPLEPSLSMVELTEYSHLKGDFVRPDRGDALDTMFKRFRWYNFVIFSVFVYGFIPRLFFLMVASLRIRYVLADTPRNNVDLVRIGDWMREPVVSTRPDGPEPAALQVPPPSTNAEPALPPPGTAVELLDGAPPEAAQILGARYGWTIGPGGPLVAVVSAWEEPTKGQLRRFKDLGDRLLIVALYDPTGKDDPRRARIRDRWKRNLPAVAARVRVEAL